MIVDLTEVTDNLKWELSLAAGVQAQASIIVAIETPDGSPLVSVDAQHLIDETFGPRARLRQIFYPTKASLGTIKKVAADLREAMVRRIDGAA